MYYSLKNLSATVAFTMEKPWEYSATSIPAEVTDKAQYAQWAINNATNHAFISAVEGTMPGIRVGNSNPLFKMHALIVDYDASVTPSMIAGLLGKPPAEFKPRYVCRSFSGGARLIWTFERPILLASNEQYKRLVSYMTKTLKLIKWLPGLDTGALGNASQYYEVGKDWCQLFPQDIPAGNLYLWLYETSKDLSLTTENDYTIPIDKVAEEVERKWPGRWKGSFEIGARGLRFWDASASDETGCVVMKHGVMAFSGEQAFLSWRRLLGQAFVEHFEADRTGDLIENTAYDGRDFWFFNGRQWVTKSKEDYTQNLRVLGFDPARRRGDTASEIDKIQVEIKDKRRVERAMPFIYHPPGLLKYDGTLFLNISTVKLMEAAPPNDALNEWKSGKTFFPFIYAWWNEMFGLYGVLPTPTQLVYVLGELWYAYTNILMGNPKPRHVQIIAGDVNCGKTLYTQKALGSIYGGCTDANDYFVEGKEWTEHVFDHGLLCVDDPTVGYNPSKIARMTSTLKRLPANGMVMYNAKFKKSGQLPYRGGVTFTLNMDDTSMGLMPDLDSSTKDKFCLFYAAPNKTVKIPPWGELDVILAQELPHLLRFILNWKPPAELFAPEYARFGIKAYHNPELLQASLNIGNAGIVLELLIEFTRMYKEANPMYEEPYWEGTATSLYELMSGFGLTTVKQQTVRGFATSLGVLQNRGVKIKSVRDSKTLERRWKVDLSLADTTEAIALMKGMTNVQ